MTFNIQLEREADGRWVAEVPALPGILTYGQDRDDALLISKHSRYAWAG